LRILLGNYEIKLNNLLKNKYLTLLAICSFVLAFSIIALSAQFPGGKPHAGERIVLQNADSLIGSTDDENNVTRTYQGNVAFSQGDVNVTCNKALQNITANSLELFGKVVITQRDMKLSSPKVYYDGSTGVAQSFTKINISDASARLEAAKGYYSTQTHIANFYNNIKITDDTVTIYSDSVEYSRVTRRSLAYGGVKIEDDSTIILADSAENWRDDRKSFAHSSALVIGKYNNTYLFANEIMNSAYEKYSLASGAPKLFRIDSTVKDSIQYNKALGKLDSFKITMLDTISLSADTMEVFQNTGDEKYLFRGGAELFKKDLKAKAENISYHRNRGDIVLIGKPAIWIDSTQIIADTIFVYSQNSKLEKVVAVGSAFATMKIDTVNQKRINQLSGAKIVINFATDTIRRVNSYGDAKSLLFMDSEKGSEGAARTFADTIYIEFNEGKPELFGAVGGVVGEAVPDKMSDPNPQLYYLPDYKRLDAQPQKKILSLSEYDNRRNRK
jgi:lipopolysaccharide assembly outer membrane protein LptD (OstA)